MRTFVSIGVCVAVGTILLLACATTQKGHQVVGDHPNFEQACSKCHTLDRVETAHDAISKTEMRKIVERMAKKPGSDIDPHDIDFIVEQIY